ncbi:MAG: hypothetical protein Ct9H300mP15_15980 [Gemmatimonadota bacterium]|nr:MAG: hypothetical protein Ct9H300mP15_15980 [Gemmatimonadota bacterium]
MRAFEGVFEIVAAGPFDSGEMQTGAGGPDWAFFKRAIPPLSFSYWTLSLTHDLDYGTEGPIFIPLLAI